MSCLENDILEEKAFEVFCEAACDDYNFRTLLAAHFLEGMEYYLFCKDDRCEYLDDQLDSIFDYVLKGNWEETVRNPVEAAKLYMEASR